MDKSVYIEYKFRVRPVQPASDILIAELGEAGFESFVEQEEGILAYIQKADWHDALLQGIQIMGNPNFKIEFDVTEIEPKNWNTTWERNFNPIRLGNQCEVRAPFHVPSNTEFDIVIEPKMSFGTGHHETTYMMLQHILENDFAGKTVLDMGSGTGVLAILAAKKGAGLIDAIDIDTWCFVNAKENVERNDCPNITVLEGDSGLLSGKKYDIILANINRNILLKDIPVYVKSLSKNGALFLSGFYETDSPMIDAIAIHEGLKFKKKIENNKWVAVKYVF